MSVKRRSFWKPKRGWHSGVEIALQGGILPESIAGSNVGPHFLASS